MNLNLSVTFWNKLYMHIVKGSWEQTSRLISYESLHVTFSLNRGYLKKITKYSKVGELDTIIIWINILISPFRLLYHKNMKLMVDRFRTLLTFIALLLATVINVPLYHQHAESHDNETMHHHHDVKPHVSNDYELTPIQEANVNSRMQDISHDSHYHAHNTDDYRINRKSSRNIRSTLVQEELAIGSSSDNSNLFISKFYTYAKAKRFINDHASKTSSGLSPPYYAIQPEV